MEVYIVAVTQGKYMFPVIDKVYKRKNSAVKALDKYKQEHPNDDNCKVLTADNWHEVQNG